jgi:hypothetical protein
LENTAVVNDYVSPAERTRGGAWSRFWFSAVDPTLLHRIRLLGGCVLLAWMLSFVGHQESYLSLGGWIDREAYVQASQMEIPPPVPIGWSLFYLAGSSRALFDALYWGSIFVTLLFTLGLGTRITGVLTWVAVVSFLGNPATSYDADFLLGILAFYLMLGYLALGIWNGRLSPLEYVLGPHDAFVLAAKRTTHSYAANLTLRLLQVHFAIIVVTSGLHKLQIGDWWSGVALWYPLHPPFATTLETLNGEKGTAALSLGVLSLVQYLALAWQIGFPMFAWRGGWWRVVLVGGALLGWAGSALIFGLPWFGPFYVVGSLSYLHAEDWQRVTGWFGRRGDQTHKRPARGAARVGV